MARLLVIDEDQDIRRLVGLVLKSAGHEVIGSAARLADLDLVLGLAIATALAREGARVVINGRTEASVSAAMSEIRGSVPNAIIEGFAGDLATPQAAELLRTKFPAVDILVNNLGIFEPKPFEQISDDDWRRFFEVNVLSGVRLSRMYLPGMKDRGWGRIVFISSESAINTPGGMIHYGTTKTAQLAVSRSSGALGAGATRTDPTAVQAFLDGYRRLR
jgi:NAD(P)-dependent dehydrogenase (short-subunit alcohol dehydrogenase family)